MQITVDNLDRLDFEKGGGLLPAVVQDATSGAVLMVGWMNPDALRETLYRGRVVFWSRSRRSLWEKGETSGNTLSLHSITADCDLDTLLVTASPGGPTCHLGTTTCFGEPSLVTGAFIGRLQSIIASRLESAPADSYTARIAGRSDLPPVAAAEAGRVVAGRGRAGTCAPTRCPSERELGRGLTQIVVG